MKKPRGDATSHEKTPEFLEYYAKVLEREADARPNDPASQKWMRAGAARARREAAAMVRPPIQLEMFGGKT